MLPPLAGQLERYLGLLVERQKLVASNLANLDTPGYQTRDIDFQFEFLSLARGARPNVFQAPGLPTKSDGNNVSLDRETRLLGETALRYNAAAAILKGQINAVRSAIKEGRG